MATLTDEQRALLEYWAKEAGAIEERKAFLAALRTIDAQREEIERLKADEAEASEGERLRQAEVSALVNAILRKGLLPEEWNSMWGPWLERLGEAVEVVVRENHARIAALEAENAACRKERDGYHQEVLLLRDCVSAHLHGGNGGQDLANAYAALRRFDALRSAKPGKEGA